MPNESNQQSISDDQELAKVLAGVTADTDQPQAEEVVTTNIPTPPVPADDSTEATVPALPTIPTPPVPDEADANAPAAPSLSVNSAAPAASGDLENIKQEALGELRPLVDKLDVSPEEKFDTYLLLLRSTDDKELIGPAHDAAKAITDEARRAQALLDIIKEIDFLSQSQK